LDRIPYPGRLINRISTALYTFINMGKAVASSAISSHASIIVKKNEEF
jgi:hypothetical protein